MRIDQLDEKQKLRLEYIISRKAQLEKTAMELLDRLHVNGEETNKIDKELMELVYGPST